MSSGPADRTAATDGLDAYAPLPKEQRHGVAVCLSGGGYRATLFHLGALRRLNELGLLSRADTITSVSGGSLAAAQLATHVARLGSWPEAGQQVPDWDTGVAKPLQAFTQTDVRTGPVLRGFSAGALATHYAAGPASGRIQDLPTRPRFVFCATDMQFRRQFVFDTGRRVMGDDEAGYRPLDDEWPMARAAAASCSVPGVFAPMRVHARPEEFVGGAYDGADRDQVVAAIDLSDGGVSDNLGVGPVWQDHSCLFVSDAGPCYKPDPRLGPAWRFLRFAMTMLEQATDVRKRWLISRFLSGDLEGAYWAIDGLPKRGGEDEAGTVRYSDRLVRDVISQIRIDLDAFSEDEAAVLENHGYAMAELALRGRVDGLVSAGAPQARSPHPASMDEDKAAQALAESSRTKLFARGVAVRRTRWFAVRR